MTVQIGEEDRQRLDRLVATGRFESVEAALHACIDAAEPYFETPRDAAWSAYLEDSIEAGLRSAAEGPLIPVEEVIADLRSRRRPAA